MDIRINGIVEMNTSAKVWIAAEPIDMKEDEATVIKRMVKARRVLTFVVEYQ